MNLYVNNTNGTSGLRVTEDNVKQVFDKLVRRTYERGGRTIKENPDTPLIELSDSTVWWLEDKEGNQSKGGSGLPGTDQLENEVRGFS